jgi:hypothetical protein
MTLLEDLTRQNRQRLRKCLDSLRPDLLAKLHTTAGENGLRNEAVFLYWISLGFLRQSREDQVRILREAGFLEGDDDEIASAIEMFERRVTKELETLRGRRM